MDITLSVNKDVARRAGAAATKMGKSLNQALCDYLEQRAKGERRAQEWERFEARCLQSKTKFGMRPFDRDAANERR